ncbi:MAG: hypothetical protein ACFHXK_20945 [bacterium]
MKQFLDRYALWSGWIMLAVIFAVVVPLGAWGLLGGIAAVAPLVLLVKPQLYRRHALLFGLLAITSVALSSAGDGGILPILASIVLLSVGIGLAPGVSERRPLVDGSPVKHVENRAACLGLLAAEVGRARRHERPLRVVALGYQDSTERTTNDHQLSLLKQAVQQEVHMYCPVYQFETHVVTVVPELQEHDLEALLNRLYKTIKLQALPPVYAGVAAFPLDAVTSTALLDKALENCAGSALNAEHAQTLTVVGGTGFKAGMPSP